jgi:ketosteroid isomerase-like protein
MARAEVTALHATFVAGIERRDAALVASVYGPDARLLPPGSPSVTGPAIQEFWQAILDFGVSGCVLESTSTTDHGDVLIDEGRYKMRISERVVDTGNYVAVHDRQPDGSWRCNLDIWNSGRPASWPTLPSQPGPGADRERGPADRPGRAGAGVPDPAGPEPDRATADAAHRVRQHS